MISLINGCITEQQERTWGRVYVQFEIDNKPYYVFKNWIKFEEHNYCGEGTVIDEPAFNWFSEEKRHCFTDFSLVINGEFDNLKLIHNDKYIAEYGTPSKILKQLLIEIKANCFEAVKNRRGWYDRLPNYEIKRSKISISSDYKTILLVDYDVILELQPMFKLVFIFYLKHPEGVRFSEMDLHKNELFSLYSKITRSTDKEKIESSIEKLISLSSNSLNEKISKVNHIIKSLLGDRIGELYCIKGVKSEKYSIPEHEVKFLID